MAGLGTGTNFIPASAQDPQDEATRGAKSGVVVLSKTAFRTDVDIASGDALIIADNTTNTPTVMTAAGTFDIAYNNATDGASTTGALILEIEYLDASHVLQTAQHTLGGGGSDTTSFSGLGINRAEVISSGTGQTNTNNITITATTGGSVQAFIPAGLSTSQQLFLHIPTGNKGVIKSLLLNALQISGGGSPRVIFKIRVYNRVTVTQREIFRHTVDTAIKNDLVLEDPINLLLNDRDVAWITANTDIDNTEVSAALSTNIYTV